MSGHSKWHNIKHKKGAEDAKKSKIFSKMSRLISVAAKQGGGDVDANPALRLAVQKAKDSRMPKENIERAIKKGTGQLEGSSYAEVIYEAYGPEGGAFLLHCLTDNGNRTVAELRSVFGRAGGSLGEKGSTAYIFESKTKEPTFTIEISEESKAGIIDQLIEDLEDHEDIQDIFHNYQFS
ncbi:YebC/PmpR family DNA-binding transcriptional regulator [Patescibacteria group bacterium]